MEAMTDAHAAGNCAVSAVSRKQWVDGLRALAILFVILGHQIPEENAYFVFTSPIKIPLFFMITGYVFNDSRTSVREFFHHLLMRLIIPWFCLTVPFAVIKIPSGGFSVFLNEILALVSGKSQWYMPCCIIAEIIWFFIRKYARKNHLTCLCTLGVFILGMIAMRYDVLGFAMLNRAMIMLLFILLGYLFHVCENKIIRISWLWTIILGVLYVGMGFVSLMVWPGVHLDIHMNQYYNIPLCFAMMILGCFTAFLTAQKLGKAPRIMRFIGENTLVYYLLHSFVISKFVKLMTLIGITLQNTYVAAFLKLLACCVGCALLALILNRFCPEAVGKKRKNRV